MITTLMQELDGYIQFVAVLIVFILVLVLTAFVTKWIAKYQKQHSVTSNIEIVENTSMSNGKYIQIIRIGETYMAIAVCKDTVTALCEVPKEQILEREIVNNQGQFKELFLKAIKKDSGNTHEMKDDK